VQTEHDHAGKGTKEGAEMKVQLAGATGTLGVPLVRALIVNGHEVIGLSRTPGKRDDLLELVAETLVADVMDSEALLNAVEGLKTDAVAHKPTALKRPPMRHSCTAATDALRVRRKGECEQSLISCLC
jgi:nucleoside-diphosphate-sugar epimerase